MYDLMIAYHLVKINQIFSKNPPTSSHHPPNFLHQKAQVEVHHEISEPQSGFPEGMVKRSTGSTPMGLLVVGGSFSQKIKPGLVGRIGGIIYNYRIFWKQFGIRCFFETNAWTAQFVVDVYLFCFLDAFVVAQVFPRYDHLIYTSPGTWPHSAIYSSGSNGNKSDDAPPLPVPPPPPAPVSAEADSAAVRFGLKGDSRNGRGWGITLPETNTTPENRPSQFILQLV